MSNRKRLPEALNNYEQLALLKQPNPRAPTGLRNLCIINLMLKTGLRVNEIIELNEADIDWVEGKIKIKESRSARSRALWLEKGDLALLKRWHEIKPEGGGLLFTTLDGSKLNDRYLREMIKRLSRKAGIEKDVYPHLLRYTFAVNLMREIRSIRLLQQALGHRDQSATQMYINLLFNELSEPEFSPEGGVRSGMPVQNEDINPEKTVWKYMVYGREEGVIKKDKDQFNQKNENKQNQTNQNNHVSRNDYRDENKIEEAGHSMTEAHESNQEQSRDKPKDKTETHKKEDKEPNISIVAESGYDDGQKKNKAKKPIPPIKCSHCSYILSYQDDCPKCGTAFNEIVKHWRRNLW